MTDITPRQKVVLAALAAERSSAFAPVQVQKLFFLLDQNIAADFGGRQFNFEPYDYGPFDRAVYSELEALAQKELVAIEAAPGAKSAQFFTYGSRMTCWTRPPLVSLALEHRNT